MKKPFAENVKGTVIIDRRVYRDILKENLALMNKLEKAKEALEFYADESHYQKECVDRSFHSGEEVRLIEEVIIDNGRIARNILKEIEK